VRELIRDAESAYNRGDNARAKSSFGRVISDHDASNGSALYGLGLIASREENSVEAQQFFERVVKSPTADPDMKVWAYIFLGRIFDLDCERSRAVEAYEQAVKIGDNTRNAQAAAKEGVSKPWGDACR
jgi:tetratricopeptide (TPR) repeat protein